MEDEDGKVVKLNQADTRTRERMIEVTRIREAKREARKQIAEACIVLGFDAGRLEEFLNMPDVEVYDREMRNLERPAIEVLKRQMKADDERIAQTAAIKVIEYTKGKPTQKIKQESEISVVEYRSAAFRPIAIEA